MAAHDLPSGQHQARTRWGTHASGAAFDQKKTPFLTDHAQQFLTHQRFCVIAGQGQHQELTGCFAMLTSGAVRSPDRHTCILDLDDRSGHTSLIQELHQAQRLGRTVPLGLFFIDHATRQRLCVQGTAELVRGHTSQILPFAAHHRLQVRLHVQQAFFHCSKYIRTRLAGLTIPVQQTSDQLWLAALLAEQGQQSLTEPLCAFVGQQELCFLCTRDHQGRCAVNHRGGAPGFLLSLPASPTTARGVVVLPDYAGNGAFEAIGNLLETRQAALLIPSYAAQVALCLSGLAFPVEIQELSAELVARCPGAQRFIVLWVQHLEIQRGDWSATLASEQAHAQAILARRLLPVACSR